MQFTCGSRPRRIVGGAPVVEAEIIVMTVPLALHPAQDAGPRSAPLPELVDDDDESIMTKGPDGVIRQLKDRLRILCKRRRIRLQEFFKAFDAHHNKKITKGQFRRALDQAGLTTPPKGAPVSDLLTQKEVEMLSRRYEVRRQQGGALGNIEGEGAYVNYFKLCEQIEKVFTRRGLEKNPTLDVKLSLEGRPESGYGVRRPGLSAEEVLSVGGLLSRIRLLAATEGLIVEALFKTFDKRHSGKVTAPIFLRQLDSMFKGKLSKIEARLLLRAYQTKNGNANWRALHHDCSFVENIAVVAAVCDQKAQQQQCDQKSRPCSPRKNEEREECQSMCSSLGSATSPNHATDDDDDDRSSVVSSVTGFPDKGVVGFHVVTKERPENSTAAGIYNAGEAVGARRAWGCAALERGRESLAVERQMASKLVYHRLEPEDAFTAYDPTHSGTITEAVFRRGLGDAFRMPFTERQLSDLSDRYRVGENKVSFRKMCDHISTVAENAAIDKLKLAPTGRSSLADAKSAPAVNDEIDEEQRLLDKTLETIQATLRRRRLSLQPGFTDFDTKEEGHVSVGKLERVLCSYGVLPADPKAQAALRRRYSVADDPRHPVGLFVSYRKLLEDLGEGPRGAPGGSLDIGREGGDPRFKGHQHEEDCGNGGPSSVSIGNSSAAAPQLRVFGKPTGLVRPGHSIVSEVSMTPSLVLGRHRDRSAKELVTHFKSFVLRSRLRTIEFFRCEDPLRRGCISREKFGRSLLSTGFRMSPTELENLSEEYTESSRLDDGGMPFVRYKDLVEEVDGVFGVRELERQPQCDVDASVHAAQTCFTADLETVMLPDATPFTPEEEEMVMETLREMGAQVHRRRLSLAPQMQGFDRFKRGVVQGTMFERALSTVGLLPGRRKTRLLRRKFAELFSAPDARSDVNYRAFLAAMQLATEGHEKIPNDLLFRANTVGPNKPTAESSITSTPGRAEAATLPSPNGPRSEHAGNGKWLLLENVVREIFRQLAVGYADITDFLSDADRLKQGEVSLPKLKVALALARVELTNEELSILEAGFKSDRNDDMVDWRRLAIAVNKVGSNPVTTSSNGEISNDSPQTNPRHTTLDTDKLSLQRPAAACTTAMSKPSPPAWGGVGWGEQGMATKGDSIDREIAEKALDAVRCQVKHYRMHLKPSFQDFDPARTKKITRRQFLSVLGNINLSFSEKEHDAICRRYTVHERSPGERIQYAAFCDDISPEAEEPCSNSPSGL